MKVDLHNSPHPSAAHAAIFLPWLRATAAIATRNARPVAVIVPARSDAYFLKALALSAGLDLFGIHFTTPGELRDRLARHLTLTATVPLREHLHLLLAAAAERCGPDAAGIALAPDHLLKAVDLLSAGGWSFREIGPTPLRPVVEEFERLLTRAGFELIHDADRTLLARSEAAPACFSALFVIGFDGRHWPQWPLLAAAVRCAENATVCLTDPRPEAESLDATWIGTWEEHFGEALPVLAEEESRPFVELLRLPESKSEILARQSAPSEQVEFLVGRDTAEQAQAIVAKALHYLANPACIRLGVLFPGPVPLARRVAALLAERDVPHDDALGYQSPGPLETADWPAWTALQENPRLPALLRFLRARGEAPFAGLPVTDAADGLHRIFNDLLIDDLGVIAEYLDRHPRKKHSAELAAGLRSIIFLPAQNTLARFTAETITIFNALGWDSRAAELARHAEAWAQTADLEISRRAWLRWLAETLVSWRPERAPGGNHPYSRVHLLPYSQAESQSWTHLIVAGLNEGRWPAAIEDSGYVAEEEIDALNRRTGPLNRRATEQGRQGEGHDRIAQGRALCIGPAQRRDLALRQFLNTIESVSTSVAATAQIIDEAAPERRLNPGDFFTRLYFCARGRALSQEAMGALREETARWLDAAAFRARPAPDLASVQATRTAYDARRDTAQPFGEYEFSLREPPADPLHLAATEWENALRTPALVWMRRLLGVDAADSADETPWSLATGQWVHQWLRAIAQTDAPNQFAAMPPPMVLLARVSDHASGFLKRVNDSLTACHRPIPDWWLSAWQQALHIAAQLAARVAAVKGFPNLATEYTIPDTAIPLDGGGTLHVRGRVDLILSGTTEALGGWIVDYKTGNRKGLTSRKLAGGDGLQLALYALALRAQGASLLTTELDLFEPQLSLSELTAQTRLWRGLLQMQETAVFGMTGKLRDEFSFAGNYPLATLAIDEAVLDEKWAHSQPDLCDVEETE